MFSMRTSGSIDMSAKHEHVQPLNIGNKLNAVLAQHSNKEIISRSSYIS